MWIGTLRYLQVGLSLLAPPQAHGPEAIRRYSQLILHTRNKNHRIDDTPL